VEAVSGAVNRVGKTGAKCVVLVLFFSATSQVAKLCNNLAAAIQLTSIAEAMNLGVALGIDPSVLARCVGMLHQTDGCAAELSCAACAFLLASAMNTSTARCWSSAAYVRPVAALGSRVDGGTVATHSC